MSKQRDMHQVLHNVFHMLLDQITIPSLANHVSRFMNLLNDVGTQVGPPRWGVRGGGGRNRGQGGRFKGLDPVVPVTDTEILQSIADFYGISPEFPLWDQIITRQAPACSSM